MKAGLLSETHPEIWRAAIRFPAGLNAVSLPGDDTTLLIVKLPHQFLLTARMNRGFKIYVVPLDIEGGATVGLMSAFFEDLDSPLTAWSPLSADPASRALMAALSRRSLTVRLFDEHDRELLGYTCSVSAALMATVRLEHTRLYPLTHELDREMGIAAEMWFCSRVASDDVDCISIDFKDPLYPENRTIRDERPELFSFHGSKGFAEVPLVKLEPGQFQELDIILLLQRVFKPSEIYHGPRRNYDNEEIADVVVITDDLCLIIQAKDSPNTEGMLSSTLERKRLKAHKQLHEGCIQIGGAINYFLRTQPLVMRIDQREEVIDVGGRNILTLVVVRELFVDEIQTYSARLMQLYKQIDFPCIALGYGELIQHATYCNSEEAFVSAYFQIFDNALKTGLFPRLRFGVRDLFDSKGNFKFD